jgi:hypothetical protein
MTFFIGKLAILRTSQLQLLLFTPVDRYTGDIRRRPYAAVD